MSNNNSKGIFYKTVREKAAEWSVSTRHLQYLCKKGRIEGVIKKAGVWFIPDDAPIPVQHSKSNVNYNFVGTKKKIFICATSLIKSKGFETVSIKDIADNVGITQSSVYNHFKSKQEILDTIYDFYRYHFLKDRPSLEDIDPILKNGSLVDIIRCVTYSFKEDCIRQMSDITAIVYYRCSIDIEAKELVETLLINEGVTFVEAVFNRAVELGRLAPLDTHAMAVFINSVKIYVFQIWIVDPSLDTSMKAREDEIKLFQYASRLLTDLKFPNESN